MKIVDTPKVSVIIPIYNVEPYLPECLESLLKQTLEDIEIICIDDGSTDGSFQVTKEYQKRDGRIKVLQQPNYGAGTARNMGLKVAKGKYLSILDADDFFDNEMLERAYRRAEATSAEIVMFRFNRYDHQRGIRYDLPHMMNKANFPSKDTFSIWDMKNGGKNYLFSIYGWTWDKLFLKSFVDKWGLEFQETRIYNDMFFSYSALAVAKKITYFEDALLCQRVNRIGAISKSVQKNWNCVFEALLAVKEFFIKNNLYVKLQRDFNEYALHMILFTYRQVQEPEREYMRIVCRTYGLKSLGIGLIDSAVGLNEAEVSEAKKEFFDLENRASQPVLNRDFELEEKWMREKIQNLESEIAKIHLSASYRIGRFITFIPRKVRGGLRCFKEHGWRYTWRRVLVHLGLKEDPYK